MSFLAKLYLLLGLVATLYAKSLLTVENSPPSENLYDVLVKNCPILAHVNDSSFKNQDIFKKCILWHKISETKNLTAETDQEVLCLLYYDSFISFCTELNTQKITNVTINLVPDLKDYNIERVCKNLTLFPAGKTFEHSVNKIISVEGLCYKLCLHYDGTPVHECFLAHYFANYNVSSLTKVELPSMPQLKSSSNKAEPELSIKALNHVGADITNAQSNPNSDSNVNQTQNKKAVVLPDSAKTVSNAGNTTGNKIAGPVSDSVGNGKPGKDESATNKAKGDVTPTENKSQTETKSQDQSETKAKDEQQQKIQSVLAKNSSEQNTQGVTTNQGKSDKEQTETDQPIISLDGDDSYPDADSETPEQNVNENPSTFDKNEKDNQVNGDGEDNKNEEKPNTLTLSANSSTLDVPDGDSYFFSYFMVISVLFVLGYVGYHNRQKVMALMLEGKRGKRQIRGRRPNSANYHKLDSNLEEAISSTCTKNSSHVIY